MLKIGVLAMQGAFREHIKVLKQLGVDTVEVRLKEQLSQIDGLIIPGGESTTIGKMLKRFDLMDTLKDMGKSGFPLFGTCAGMVMLSKHVEDGMSGQPLLDLMNVVTVRNAFGRQVESFEADLEIDGLGDEPFHCIFIRAPFITKVLNSTKILSTFNDKIVAVKEGNMLATSFHPELTEDTRLHKYFINIVKRWKEKHGKN